jgi:hypothetical protein
MEIKNMDKLKFFIQNIQSALFIENFAFRNKISIVDRINKAVDNLFDGDPIILPIPSDAPPEIPRITLNDSKSNYRLIFSPIRLDFFYNDSGKPEKVLDALKNDYFRYLFSIVALVTDEYHLTVPRVALVIKAVSEIERGPNIFMQEKFLGNNPFFNDTYKLEIHALKKTAINGYDINHWFRIRTATVPTGEYNPLSVQIDINTLQEKPLELSLQGIKDFFDKSINFARTNLSECFGVSL